ncbi:MAG: HDOD domain-containing protein [Gammaproteobacteria bacterium]
MDATTLRPLPGTDRPAVPPSTACPGPRDVAAGVRRLVTFPQVYFALREVISDPDSSLDDVATLVERDPALAAGLLRLANSAYYHSPAPVTRIAQAVSMLGMLQVHDFVLGSVVMRAFPRISPELVDMRRFWRSSLVAATAARRLAQRAGHLDSGRLFLLGLLARIGRLAIWLQLPRDARALLDDAHGNFLRLSALERARLGFDAAQVGAALLEAWQLPGELVGPIAAHARPGIAGARNPVVAMVHAATCIADGVDATVTVADLLEALDPHVLEALALEAAELPGLIDQVMREATALAQVFEAA